MHSIGTMLDRWFPIFPKMQTLAWKIISESAIISLLIINPSIRSVLYEALINDISHSFNYDIAL